MPSRFTPLTFLVLLAACAPRVSAPVPAPVPEPAPAPAPVLPADPSEAEVLDYIRARQLIVPVAGVGPEKVPDTFGASRGARRHGALDILAPRGTPVLSADDGRVLRVSSNALGGLTVYATDPGERLVYYYAHLDRYREGLAAGMRLARGDTIGFVGTTGNAPADTPHLHFQVMLVVPDRKYWNGEPIDPRPYLTANGTH
ncbi:MAG TPA: M23 family metallopeptidase [Gemmatimonadaceae bacterium]|nr:M23 family metallopeptidase [Gemmatimonadaceae bacterium]